MSLLLVTGGGGFVMSVLARHWLARDPHARAIVLDRAPLDAVAQRYFTPVAERLIMRAADVTSPHAIADALDGLAPDFVVHGATVTPIARFADADPEASDPARVLDVNLMGTVHMLDWARNNGVRRFLYVSSGAVYRHDGPDHAGAPLPEDGYVGPRRLYGISKYAAELTAARYAALFPIECVSVRLSSVYGPMDRETATRSVRHLPNIVATAAAQGRTLLADRLDAIGDYISAEDVATGIAALLDAQHLRHDVYNIALGETATTADLVAHAAARCPGFTARVVAAHEAELRSPNVPRGGMWGAYDIARITAETGWRPRPLGIAMASYIDWLIDTTL